MRRSIRCSRKCAASPSAPPNPPMRTGTGWRIGAMVRPASDSVTASAGLAARCRASCRASMVPPRTRTRMSADPLRHQTAAPRRWLSIVGIGEDGTDGLGPLARRLIEGADIVFGGKRHLALAKNLIRGAARAWPSPFDGAVAEVLAHRTRQVCVLASGDPFCHGVGAVLAHHVAAEQTIVVPAPSAFSLAAARLGWALPGVTQLSLHGRAIDLIRPHLQP